MRLKTNMLRFSRILAFSFFFRYFDTILWDTVCIIPIFTITLLFVAFEKHDSFVYFSGITVLSVMFISLMMSIGKPSFSKNTTFFPEHFLDYMYDNAVNTCQPVIHKNVFAWTLIFCIGTFLSLVSICELPHTITNSMIPDKGIREIFVGNTFRLIWTLGVLCPLSVTQYNKYNTTFMYQYDIDFNSLQQQKSFFRHVFWNFLTIIMACLFESCLCAGQLWTLSQNLIKEKYKNLNQTISRDQQFCETFESAVSPIIAAAVIAILFFSTTFSRSWILIMLAVAIILASVTFCAGICAVHYKKIDVYKKKTVPQTPNIKKTNLTADFWRLSASNPKKF